MSGIIHKQNWSDSELKKNGFHHYERKKTLVMARILPANEAPLKIHTRWGETLIAKAGYIICYTPGDKSLSSLEQYDQWPVEPSIFAKTYKRWNQQLQVTPAIRHLLIKGCRPYYKVAGVWAKPLTEDVYVQSLEDEEPELVKKDHVLAIGIEGEPYHMGAETFADRYDTKLQEDKSKKKNILNRLIGFLKGDGI